MKSQDIVISSRDAALLDALVRRADHLPGTDEAVEELSVALEAARIVDATRIPRTVVGLGATVDYLELPAGRLRTVVLAHPVQADASRGRLSVLSPLGRALLGRQTGSLLEIATRSGTVLRIQVLRVHDEQQARMAGPRRPLAVLQGSKSTDEAAPGAMAHSAYPLALYAWDPAEIAQTGFGVYAALLIDDRHAGVVPEATASGLTLFARSEPDLVAPIDELLAHFGRDRLRLTGPQVRFWPSTPPRWPVMAVWVEVPGPYAPRVRLDLVDRGAASLVVDHGPRTAVITAELPQTKLIGYPGWLHEVTDGRCELAIRLSCYAPPERAPGAAPG